MSRIRLMVVGAILSMGTLSLEAAERLPQSMGALGDSITAAAVSNTDRSDKKRHVFGKLLRMAFRFGFFKSIRALEFRHLSWSTGVYKRDIVDSHAEKIIRLHGKKGKRKFKRHNASFSGAKTQDLAEQLKDLRRWSEKKLNKKMPDYITLLIGANDACSGDEKGMTPLNKFHSRVNKSLIKIKSLNPKAKILISSVPNILRLKEASVDKKAGFFKSCQELWDRMGICQNFLGHDEELQAVSAERLQEYNLILEDLAREHAHRGSDDSVRFVPAVYEYPFKEFQLAADCFHPNDRGQDELSRVSWEQSWW